MCFLDSVVSASGLSWFSEMNSRKLAHVSERPLVPLIRALAVGTDEALVAVLVISVLGEDDFWFLGHTWGLADLLGGGRLVVCDMVLCLVLAVERWLLRLEMRLKAELILMWIRKRRRIRLNLAVMTGGS